MPNQTPQYVNLATQLSQLNQAMCSAQEAFAAWENACAANSASFFQEWLALFLSRSSNPNVDGPNDPNCGEIYSTCISPLLNIVGVWNQLLYLVDNIPIEMFPSFLAWWKTPCSSSSSVNTFISSLNALLPFSLIANSQGYAIGQCTGNTSQVAATLVSLVQSYSSSNLVCNMGLCAWNTEVYIQAWQSISKTPPSTNYNCIGNCQGSSCTCTTSTPIPPTPPCLPAIYSVFVPNISQGNSAGVNVANSFTSSISSVLNNYNFNATGEIAVSQNGDYLYVAGSSSPDSSSGDALIFVVNLLTNTIVKQISIGSRTFPSALVLTPDDNYLYAIIYNMSGNVFSSCFVSVINTSNYEIEASIPISGTLSNFMSISPNGEFVYLSNQNSTITVIDTSTNTIANQISSINNPIQIAFTPDGSTAYITCNQAVVVFDTTTNTIITSIPTCSPLGIAITPDGQYVYVTNICNGNGTGGAVVISTSTNTVVAEIPSALFYYPLYIAISPDGKYAYVSNGDAYYLSVIDVATNSLAGTLSFGSTYLGKIVIAPAV